MQVDQPTISNIFGVVLAVLVLVLRHAVVKVKDHERAGMLSTIADDAAAVVIGLSQPATTPAEQQRDVVARLAAVDALKGTNPQKFEHAAIGALARLRVGVARAQ